MIIVKLSGGLGNQMFQYAFAKQLAHKNNTTLKIDISYFETQTLREYELAVFNIPEKIISKKELSKYIPAVSKHNNRIRNTLNRLIFKGMQVDERQFHFSPEMLDLKGNIYLNGYFQSEKYFKEIEPEIKKTFQLQAVIKQQHHLLTTAICSSNSTAIHIRRGDYVLDKTTHKEHGTLPMEYYHQAIHYILSKTANPFFYIFSDDMEWTKKNLEISYPHQYIDNSVNKSYEDLYLMSLCKHQVIANSSFSWWAAWLNSNADKIVIAPKKWFNESLKNSRDIVPETWIKL